MNEKLTVLVACLSVVCFTTAALGSVFGSNGTTGSWTSTGSYSSSITLMEKFGLTTITDITVGVDIDHTLTSDVSMTLSSAAGGSVVFSANQGSGASYGSSIVGTYDWNDAGIQFPNGNPVPNKFPIGTSNPLNGAFPTSDTTWTLTIVDTTDGNGGFIGGWELTLTTVPEPTTSVLIGIAGAMAFGLRRKRSLP